MKKKLAKLDLKKRPDNLDKTILIYDQYLESLSEALRSWIRFHPKRYAVRSGENLKRLRNFPRHFENLANLGAEIAPRELTIVSLGGGSIGDFAGFFASVYKRGVRLEHVPSTWLAAIDSSHGGKTALNNGAIKNQLGTFYPADVTYLSKEILREQPSERISDAMGELGKIAIIDGGPWVRTLSTCGLEGAALLWKFLKPAINAKMAVVNRDPLETSGQRQILNLGHTVGHVFEAHYGWTHGRSVSQGLQFSIDWAVHRGTTTALNASKMRRLLTECLGMSRELPEPIPKALFAKFLIADKKRRSDGSVTFLFPVRLGRVVRESVRLTDVLKEARRQGWVA